MKILTINGKPLRGVLAWNVINIPTVVSNLTYNSKIQKPIIIGYNESCMVQGGAVSGINAGVYAVTFTPKSGYQWIDGTNETKTINWDIARIKRDFQLLTDSVIINTNETEATVTIKDCSLEGVISYSTSNSKIATASTDNRTSDLLTVKVIKAGPGVCTITVNVSTTTNYLAASCKFNVTCYSTVTVPTQSEVLTYSGSEQTPTWNNNNNLTIGGVTKATNAGTYIATFTPNTYCSWTDGTADTKEVSWIINKGTWWLELGDNKDAQYNIYSNETSTTLILYHPYSITPLFTALNPTIATIAMSSENVYHIIITKTGTGTANFNCYIDEDENHLKTMIEFSVTCGQSAPLKWTLVDQVTLTTTTECGYSSSSASITINKTTCTPYYTSGVTINGKTSNGLYVEGKYSRTWFRSSGSSMYTCKTITNMTLYSDINGSKTSVASGSSSTTNLSTSLHWSPGSKTVQAQAYSAYKTLQFSSSNRPSGELLVWLKENAQPVN